MKEGNGQVQRYEIKNYFGRSYASTCQHCGITIYKRNRNGNGKHAWLTYSKAAYRADAEFEVLCRGCYDNAVRKYGPMISRDEMLKKIDKLVRAEAKKSSTLSTATTTIHRTGTSRIQENFEQPQELQQTQKHKPTQKHQSFNESFKPYPIYTRSNVNLLLNAYKKAKQPSQLSDINEATIKNFLTFITGFTVGVGMTKRPVMLDAAHKYIKSFKSFYEEQGEAVELDSITDFFDSMAALGMIRESVAKKARNICTSQLARIKE